MARYFSLAILLLLLRLPLLAQAPNILLGRPTQNSVTASILFEQASESYVVFGREPGVYTDSTSLIQHKAGVPDHVLIPRCAANAQYFYRVKFRKTGIMAYSSTNEYRFHTQRAPGTSFRFDIEADEHLYDKKGIRSMYQVTLANQAKDKADFLLSLGDIFGDDHTPTTTTSKDMDDLHKDYRQYLGEVCNSMPFFVCLGNHEGEMGYYLKQTPPNNIAVYGTLWRKFYYPNPQPGDFYSGNSFKEAYGMDIPENYYAWTWGDALFVVLDVYRHCDINEKPQNWDWTLGDAQYQWFRQTLANSKAKFKFVFAHHVRGQGRGAAVMTKGFEWGGYDNGNRWLFPDKRPGWELPIHQLMVKYGVNVFFQGHDHLFAKEEVDGIVYQEVPMAADSTYEIGVLANADAYTALTLNGTGHMRVDVTPDSVTVDFVRAYLPADTVGGKKVNGEVAHSYTVKAGVAAVNDDSFNVIDRASYSSTGDVIRVVSNDNIYSTKTITLYTIQGVRVQETMTDPGNSIVTMSAASLSNGVYYVSIASEMGRTVVPVTVLR